MTRYLGGLITKDESLVIPANNFEDTSAPGVWTLEEAQMLAKQGLWPTAGNFDPTKVIEGIFSCTLYAGTASSNTITTGIDLANNTGMVWGKRRDVANSHWVINTADTATLRAEADGTSVSDKSSSFTSFNSNGFTVATGDAEFNASGGEYVAWTFRAAPKFFDVVTYTGDGTNGRNISHNLGAAPGMIMYKALSSTGGDGSGDAWWVDHRSLNANKSLRLNTNVGEQSNYTYWVDRFHASYLDINTNVNADGIKYAAYVFGHDTSSDGMIQCGSFTDNSSGWSVDLGFEPQWLLTKRTNSTGNWEIVDTTRGFTSDRIYERLFPNLSNTEDSTTKVGVNSTGFFSTTAMESHGSTIIYVAIRKGLMRTPTSSSNVFGINAFTAGSSTSTIYDLGVKPDMVIGSGRAGSGVTTVDKRIQSRLTGMGKVGGNAKQLLTNANSSESSRSDFVQAGSSNNSVQLDGSMFTDTYLTTGIFWAWSVAKGYFDSVAYTGNGSAGRQITHNLGATPEMIWVKLRDTYTDNWQVYHSGLSSNHNLFLDTNAASAEYTRVYSPSSTIFTVSSDTSVNSNNLTYVAYLFASVTGVSKLGSFSHSNGSSTDVDCGFSSGSKFVLVKRKDSTGDWYVWDSTRGIVSGNDPYTLLNSDAAEVTNTDYIDTLSSGFQIASGFTTGDYIFYAIAA